VSRGGQGGKVVYLKQDATRRSRTRSQPEVPTQERATKKKKKTSNMTRYTKLPADCGGGGTKAKKKDTRGKNCRNSGNPSWESPQGTSAGVRYTR